MKKFLSIFLTVIVVIVVIRVLLWILNVTISLFGNLIFLALIIAAVHLAGEQPLAHDHPADPPRPHAVRCPSAPRCTSAPAPCSCGSDRGAAVATCPQAAASPCRMSPTSDSRLMCGHQAAP